MKYVAFIAVLAILPFLVASSLVEYEWLLETWNTDGLNETDFEVAFETEPVPPGFLVARKFELFSYQNEVGNCSIAIETVADKVTNEVRLKGVFTSSIGSAVSDHSNCQAGNPGVICSADLGLATSDYFRLQLTVDFFSGLVHGFVRGSKTTGDGEIGTFWVGHQMRIDTKQTGSIDYIPWRTQPAPACSTLPSLDLFVGNQVSGGLSGILDGIEDSGPCKGKINFLSGDARYGVQMSFGFEQPKQ